MLTIACARATSTAPPSAFFDRWADMATWPEWDEAVAWARLDGPFAEGGATGTLKTTGGPRVHFVITALVPGRALTDRSSLPGAGLVISHTTTPAADGGTELEVTATLDGALARLWRRVLGTGIAKSTPVGLRRLVAVAEADVAARR